MRVRGGRLAVLALLAAVLAGVGVGVDALASGPARIAVTAYFPRTIALYPGSSVRVLGVPVGTVTSITPQGTEVKVTMTVERADPVPADAGAVIVPPSIVSDRYVQLVPAYTGGPKMANGAVIPLSRTEVPLELNQIFGNLNTLNVALGPQGANRNGALSRLIAVSAANLNGNGQRLHDTLVAVGQLLGTLSANRGNLFGTLSNLQQLTTTLAQDNGGVIAVNNDLAQVSVQLNGERADLAAALRDLSVALAEVRSFVADNKATLTSDVAGLTSITGTLVKEKTSLTEFLDVAPLALANLSLAYDGKYHTLDTRSNEGANGGLATIICQALDAVGVSSCPVAASQSSGPGPAVVSGSGALARVMGVAP